MTLHKLKSLGTYEEINGGAHRKAALIVGVPSLVRHLGLWSVRAPAEGDEAREQAFRNYVERLTSIIRDRRRRALHHHEQSFVSGLDEKIDTGTVTLIRFWWHGMYATLRLEFHSEYITITSILDLSVKQGTCDARAGDDGPLSKTCRALDGLKDLFESCPAGRQTDYATISNHLQIDIWKEFEAEVLDAKAAGEGILGDSLGEIFLDSRGIVIGSSFDKGTTKALPSGLELRQSLRERFQYDLPRKRSRHQIEHRFPGAAWARETLKRIWPFVEAEQHHGECEFTVTGFLQGRVLFITALGPQSDQAVASQPAWVPIRYFLHAYTDDEWQIGRLVDRINTLGTLRLAATMQIGALKVAGGLVEKLAKEIELAGDVVQSAIQTVKASASANKAGAATDGVDNEIEDANKDPTTEEADNKRQAANNERTIEAVDNKIGEVNNIYQNINDAVSGDIHSRLERSQYYLERFKRESQELREKRIEGSQTYTEFVTRRMNSIFGYQQFLLTRMESIQDAYSSLLRQYSSLKITSVTCGIDNLVKSLNLQNNKLQEQEKEIGKIQEFGEFALIGALIPYYVASSVEHILAVEGIWKEVVWAAVTGFCALVAIGRIIWKKKDAGAWRRLGPILVLFVVYLLAMAAAFAIFRHPWSGPETEQNKVEQNKAEQNVGAPASPSNQLGK